MKFNKQLIRGFTLLELLVVLVIIGIVASITVFNVGDFRTDKLKTEAERLDILIRQFRDEALVQGKELGILFSKENDIFRYAFYEYESKEKRWRQYIEQPGGRVRFLPQWVQLNIDIDGENVPITDMENPEVPQLYLLSSGEKFSYAIGLIDPENSNFSYHISSDEPGVTLVSYQVE